MNFSKANPMARYEYKLAKENRRLAEIELKKVEIQTSGGEGDASMVLVARAIAGRVAIVFVTIFIVIGVASINDVFQNHDDQIQITNCERVLAQNHIDGNCADGLVGTMKEAKK